MKVSIIIPVLNESGNIQRLLGRLREYGGDQIAEILVVDGGSSDGTAELARQAGASVLCAPRPGRAHQMNVGAARASGDIFYFVHGDTLPPVDFLPKIVGAVKTGFPIGSFRLRLASPHPLLRLNSYMTRFPFLWCRGGDQSIYVTRQIFEEFGGYREDFCIMEEYELIRKAWKKYPYAILDGEVLASARKYDNNGYLKVQVANLVAFQMFRLGYAPRRIASVYRRLLD